MRLLTGCFVFYVNLAISSGDLRGHLLLKLTGACLPSTSGGLACLAVFLGVLKLLLNLAG